MWFLNTSNYLKSASVGFLVVALSIGVYKVYSKINDFFENVEETKKELSTAKSNNEKLRQEIKVKDENIISLSGTLNKANNDLELAHQQRIEQLKQDKERQEQYDEDIKTLKELFASNSCANERIPDAVIRMHERQWDKSRGRN